MSKPNEKILQAAYLTYDNQKIELLKSLIKDKPKYKSIIIFSSTKKNISEIVSSLRSVGLQAEAISSNLEQKQRESILQDFRARKIRILVATDVISRGIDIKDINLVINYNVPRDAEDYVHRIGRTARAESSGVAITLINPDDMRHFHNIEKLIEREIIKMDVPKELGDSPKWDLENRRRHSPKKNTTRKHSSKGQRPNRGRS
jgi:superfamily II DNA/RNA helicase